MLLSIAEYVHVSGDVNFDKLVHENMFYPGMPGFRKSGHISWGRGLGLVKDIFRTQLNFGVQLTLLGKFYSLTSMPLLRFSE